MSARYKIQSAAVAIAIGIFSGSGIAVAAETPIKFVMDWAFEGAQSIWSLAQDRGCFAKAGLNVTIDRGFGSGDALTKVAAGAYDIGVSDFSAMVGFAAKNPEKKLTTVFVISDGSLTSVGTLKGNGITKPQDLTGKSIADTPNDASRLLFPVFAKANGVDPAKVNWVNTAADMRQQILMQKRSDAVAGHLTTVTMGLRALGVKDEDVIMFRYAEWGLDFLGNVVFVTPEWAAKNPQAMSGFVACAAEGIKASITDPKAALESLRKRNPLMEDAIEMSSLDIANRLAVITPNTRKNGLSFVTQERLERTVKQAAEVFEVPIPNIAEIYTDKYLPPRSELMLP
jgi:NitT/TauT family transport system substrate-binding protein